jgi:hypothetical protein
LVPGRVWLGEYPLDTGANRNRPRGPARTVRLAR